MFNLFLFKMILSIKILLTLLLLSTTLFAQVSERPSFEEEFKQSFHTKPKLDVKFDNRFSFIRDNDVRTIGLKVGLSFDRKFKVGLGINQMLTSTDNQVSVNDTIRNVDLEYFYFSPYAEYTFYNSKRWAFSLAAQLGIGEAKYQYNNSNNIKEEIANSVILSYEPAMLIDYKIIRWFGIGTGVGYRLIYYKSSGIDEKFSSPEYVIKLKIYLGEIVRTITGKEWQIDD